MKHFRLSAEQVSQRRASEAGVVDTVEVELGDWMAEVELLTYVIIFIDVVSPLYFDVLLHTINFIPDADTKMFPITDPR